MNMIDQDRAKHPITAAAGPYGHPIHPLLVTVPIGAWVASFIFDLISHGAGEEAVFTKGAYWLIAIGVIGALVAAIFGFLDLLAIPRGTRAFKVGLTHMTLNLIVVALFVVNFLIRRSQLDDNKAVEAFPLILSIVALVILTTSGWLGGKLVYRHGVRVADEATQLEGFVQDRR
jgi:uncharacterized membrane protein